MNDNHQLPEDDVLLSAYVDGELSPTEVAAVEARLAVDARARRMVTQLNKLKALTSAMRIKDPPAEEWESFWQVHYNRLERSLGWVLFAIGGLLVLGWATATMILSVWHNKSLPVAIRWGAMAVMAGLVVLFVSVLRERLYQRRRTRYKDVLR